MSGLNRVFTQIRKGKLRAQQVRAVAMGRERIFEAYDCGADTFILERGVLRHLSERPSVLLVDKAALRSHARGWVMTVTTGNHAVAIIPLLNGSFWRLSTVPASRRGEVLQRSILCANIVKGAVELSQRDISTEFLARAENWLRETLGLSMGEVLMSERNELTLEHYRRLGQEWRVKPLAWTEREMKIALDASRKRIGTRLSYYHSARGVHFLTFSEFQRLAAWAETDPAEFVSGLRELVSVYEGNETSFVRMPKFRGHHEIEFFGIHRGIAIERLVPEVERLMEDVVLNRTGQLGVIQRAQELVDLYASLLTSPELADENSKFFLESLYMCITGEVYSVVGEGLTPSFDSQRTALPGATFIEGRPIFHEGIDDRTEVLLSNLCGMMSKDEIIEYANIYELRARDVVDPLGKGSTREVVYKTNRRPIENSLIEKRLSRSTPGYSAYLLARIGALRSLGVSLSDFYILLHRQPKKGGRVTDHYIRRRCEGESLEAIPANYFRQSEESLEESPEVVLALAALMGDAAAQNMAMKKYDVEQKSPLFGVGKEIYEFKYDIVQERVVPKSVATCSVRGSFGWPSLEYTEENLDQIADFYLSHYVRALKDYHHLHSVVSLEDMAEQFMNGFEFRTHAMEWQLSVMRDRFEAFSPDIPKRYAFTERWRFVMWSLERQDRRLPLLRRRFMEKIKE